MSSKILVVDDEPDIVEIVSFYLIDEGHEVAGAPNGREALEMLKAEHYDIVVSDVRMPECDGLMLLKTIQEMPKPRPSVILMSGFADVSPKDAIKNGALGICQKPISFDQLTELIKTNQA